ncbi:Crp/Fnr family transcriptional regulator [Bradyrhizobium sp. AZCC 2289]|uniref:Crp/Fnr family transcriptional regulator n=1 Tax=Bradyrhizobium sp. AZCC 2289 TaxID=3117026 RepID=UPI003FA58150
MLIKNAILAGLPPACFAAILPFLEQVTLKERLSLQGPRKPVEHVYFVESGIVSLRTVATEGFVEIATIGAQGAVGISSLLGGHLPAHQSIVLLPGSALRIGTEEFWRVFAESPEFRCGLLRYAQGLAIHEAQTTFCAVRHKLEQRLANWLCLASDVLDGAALALPHHYFSAALGLRRPSVTQALIRFEEQGLIRKMRRSVQVIDREQLQQKACRCCGIITSAYFEMNSGRDHVSSGLIYEPEGWRRRASAPALPQERGAQTTSLQHVL